MSKKHFGQKPWFPYAIVVLVCSIYVFFLRYAELTLLCLNGIIPAEVKLSELKYEMEM